MSNEILELFTRKILRVFLVLHWYHTGGKPSFLWTRTDICRFKHPSIHSDTMKKVYILVTKTCFINRVTLLTISSILSYNPLYLAAWWDHSRWVAAACGVQAGRIRGSRRRHCALLLPIQKYRAPVLPGGKTTAATTRCLKAPTKLWLVNCSFN